MGKTVLQKGDRVLIQRALPGQKPEEFVGVIDKICGDDPIRPKKWNLVLKREDGRDVMVDLEHMVRKL